MVLFFMILCTLAFFVADCLAIYKFMHMFQLNSYKTATQLKWLNENKSKLSLNVFILAITVLCAFINVKIGLLILAIAFFISVLFSKPKKAKKPLVFTARVKRMLITVFVLYVLGIFPLFYFEKARALIIVLGCIYALSPFVILLSNFVNKPIELSVNRYYINDAKKILRSLKNLKIIGITGSYGKTSVKYYLTSLLKAKYNVLMTPESYNTPMGIVKTIRGSLRATHEIFVCEMGAKYVGDIKEICDFVHPHHGIITSIGPQHLETFKSLDRIKKTKFELADAINDNNMLFVNGDDENIKSVNHPHAKIVYGIDNKDGYYAYDLSVSEDGTTFKVMTPSGETEEFTTKLIGKHNVLNITGAIAIAHNMGITLKELKPQVRKLENVPHRLQLINHGHTIIIDDAYNSNPSGTKAAVEALSLFSGMKIIVTPGMVELGVKQDELNEEFGANAAKVCDFIVLVGKRQAEPILRGVLKTGYPEEKTYVADTIKEALDFVSTLKSDGKKIVLLENDLPDNY